METPSIAAQSEAQGTTWGGDWYLKGVWEAGLWD